MEETLIQYHEPQKPVRQGHEEKPGGLKQKRAKNIFRIYQTVWYVLGVTESLIALRFIFKLLGANRVGFIDFLYSVTDPLAVPFYGIFNASTNGRYVIEWTTLVAMAIYGLIATGIVQFVRILTTTDPDEAEDAL